MNSVALSFVAGVARASRNRIDPTCNVQAIDALGILVALQALQAPPACVCVRACGDARAGGRAWARARAHAIPHPCIRKKGEEDQRVRKRMTHRIACSRHLQRVQATMPLGLSPAAQLAHASGAALAADAVRLGLAPAGRPVHATSAVLAAAAVQLDLTPAGRPAHAASGALGAASARAAPTPVTARMPKTRALPSPPPGRGYNRR